MALAEFLNDTAALLGDQNFLFTSQAQMVRNINETRRQIALRTGCIRLLITGQSAWGASAQPGFAIPGGAQPGALPSANPQSGSTATGAVQSPNMMTIPGVERYPYQGFFNPYLQQFYSGAASVLNAVQLSINWGGPSRPALDWMPWDEFQAYCRAYAFQNMAYPSVWSVQNDGDFGEIWIFPTPSNQLEMELLAHCLPTDLTSNSSTDLIPPGFRNNVKFGAAALTAMSRQQYSVAEMYDDQFQRRMGFSVMGRDRGKSRSYYVGAF
jgi:hypothetical protein